jgi:type IV pilus assembly protein PilY1
LETLHAIPLDAVPPDHALQPKEAFYEWYRYVNGGQVALGTNTSGNFGEASPYPDYDGKVIDSGRYMLPFTDPDACPRLYGIVGLLGPAGADADLDDLISRSLSLPPGGGFEDMLALMSHPATDLLSSTRGTVPGGGEAVLYLDQPREVEQGLAEFIDRVLSANASFVSASITVDPFEQGALLDRLYLGLFQPNGGVNWLGNVKKYRMVADQGVGGRPEIGAIVDVLGGPAFESEGPDRGKIAFNALSFWTDPDTLPPGDGVITPTGVDGREVARGGAGQKIDGFVDYLATGQRVIGDTNDGDPPLGETSRQVYVEPPVPGEFMPFNADSQTVDLVGDLLDPDAVYNRAERLALIRWGRGQDVDSGTASARRWLLGDVLHSRPLALNYGATSGYTRRSTCSSALAMGCCTSWRTSTGRVDRAAGSVLPFIPGSCCATSQSCGSGPCLRSAGPTVSTANRWRCEWTATRTVPSNRDRAMRPTCMSACAGVAAVTSRWMSATRTRHPGWPGSWARAGIFPSSG